MHRLIALITLLGLALAQFDFDPSKPWFTLSTEHFDIIYHSGLERVASEAAIYAEDAYATLKAEFGDAPTRIKLVLSDQGDYSNGFSDPTTNTVGIFAAQFRSADTFNPRLGSWWQTVIFHEIAHAIDLTQVRGPAKDAQRIFGQIPAQTAIRPYPFIEGLVVYMKYKKLGQSRLNDSNTRMVLRQMVLDGKFPTLDEIRQAYSRSAWPPLGFLVYNYGAWLVQYLEVRFGPDAVRRFAEANAGMSAFKDFNAPFQQAFGVSLDQIYADFVKWLPSQFEGEIADIRSAGLTQATKLTTLGFYSETPSDGSAGLIYSHRSPLRSGVRLRVNESERELISGGGDFPQWSPDGRYVIFTGTAEASPYSVISDLYRLDNLTGETKRLTTNSRIYYARYAPDGKSAFVARNSVDGSSELAQVWFDQNSVQTLRLFPNQDGVIHSFAIAPDGKSLVMSLLKRGGFQDLYRYVPDTGQLTPLTQNRDVESDPVFSPDGKYVIYSADVNRVYNLYALRLEDGAAFQVTNLLGGAFSPTISFSKQQIIFSGYDSSGYNLYQIPYSPNTWKPVELSKETLPEFKPAEAARGQPYNSFNYLRPLYWSPSAGLTSLGSSFGVSAGVQFSATDPVGVQGYSVSAGVDSFFRGVFYDASYFFAGLGAPITLQVVGSGPENAQALGVSFYSSGSSMGVQYVRLDTLDQPAVTHQFSVGFSTTSSTSSDLFRSRTTATVVGSTFVRENNGVWQGKVRGVLGYSFRLPVEPSHVFSLKLAGGFTTSPLSVDAFDLGFSNDLVLYLGGSPSFWVRGYNAGRFRGQQAVVGSLEYRLPPFNIERGFGNWPLFFDDLSLSVFADAGVVGSPVDWNQVKVGIGAELRMTLSLFYLTSGSSVALGVAQGIGEPGPRVYLNLVLPAIP